MTSTTQTPARFLTSAQLRAAFLEFFRERGVEPETIDQAFDTTETDWVHAAREARRRKFGLSPPADYRERAKQARFLQYRGFSSDQIRAALGPGEDDPDL